MASRVGSDLDDLVVSTQRRMPRATYNIGSACLATAASILVLLAGIAVVILV